MWTCSLSHAASQLCQSAYAPLLTPYVLVGLGQAHGYVEELATGPFRTVMRGARVPLLESTREPTSREDDAEPRESGADAREELLVVPARDEYLRVVA